MKIKIGGARGIYSSPLESWEIENKLRRALNFAKPGDISSPETIDDFIKKLPFPLKGTYGGNTPSIKIQTASGDLIIIDAGSGLINLGQGLMDDNFAEGQGEANFFITNNNLSYLQGLSFFKPFFVPENRFNIYSVFDDLEKKIRGLLESKDTKAILNFIKIEEETEFFLNDIKVLVKKMPHPFLSFGIRIESHDKVFAYTSEAQFESSNQLEEFKDFFNEADLLFFDTLNGFEKISDNFREGHSTITMGIDLAKIFQVKKIIFFNHSPDLKDNDLENLLYKAKAYNNLNKNLSRVLNIDLAAEGMEIII